MDEPWTVYFNLVLAQMITAPQRSGVTHAGNWCDVFEIRDFKIQRLATYLDPDYAGADTARYPWLNG